MTKEDPRRDSTTRFSNRVALYIKYRPHYPSRIINFLRTELGLTKESLIADIGSGTGILSKLFLDHGCQVIGVEPNDDMRAAGEAYLKEYPNFTSIKATAEATTLPDDYVDFVTAGQAFHWFDPVRSRIEFNRILKPDGYVLLTWNSRSESSPLIQTFNELMLRYSTEFNKVRHENVQADDLPTFFKPGGYQRKLFDNFQLFNLEELKGRAMSSSYAPLPEHPNFDDFMTDLEKLYTEYQTDGQVEFAYDTEVYYGQLK